MGVAITIHVHEQKPAPLATLAEGVCYPASAGQPEFEALALGDRLKFLRWLMNHAAELKGFAALFDELKAATTVAAKLRVGAKVLDLAATIADDLPTAAGEVSVFSDYVTQLSALEVEAQRRQINWGRLKEIAEFVLPIFLRFAPVFGVPLPPLPLAGERL